MVNNKYSVLMSVYYKEHPDFLIESINSMLNQTIKPDEIVLVKDGQLTDALNEAIESFSNNPTIKIIELDENVGLGNALKVGLINCKNELIARMDTDDISVKTRCEKQLEFLNKYKEVSIVGSSIAEFVDDPSNIVAYRKVHNTNNEIISYMKFRNPMNHPSTMFRKKAILDVGNYQEFFLNEDYFLWVRLMKKRYVFANLSESLVLMRITEDTYSRRGGYKYFKTQKRIFDYMLDEGIITRYEYYFSIVVRFASTVLLPRKIRKVFFLKLLRKKQ